MPIGNGGIIGPNNTPSLSSAKGVWSIQEAMLAQRAGTWPLLFTPDPYYDYTTLLLPGNGTNGAQNNTFLDSSTNNFTITRNGNTTQGTFSPFSQTGWGNYFDASGDYLTIASNTAFALPGDFTLEMWVYPSTITGALFGIGDYRAGNNGFSLYYFSSKLRLYVNGADVLVSASDIPLNTWLHFAVVRSGSGSNNLKLYINGTQQAQATNTVSFTGVSGNGASVNNDYGGSFAGTVPSGYLSNVRLVKGTAVYTSDFTPSTTPLTAISGTSLLTCQSNRFIDNSPNAFAITRNGDVLVQAFSPFNPTAAWSASTNGGSGYFDGSGDYLNTSSTQVIPSGSFTVEAWVYLTTTSTGAGVVAQGTLGNAARFSLAIEAGLWWTQIGAATINAGTPVINTWTHLAATFNGSTLTLYVNGTSVGTVSTSTNAQNTTLRIGSLGPSDWIAYYWPGYIGQVRISNTVRSISVPTALYTADANTTFLANYTNAGIYDATSKNDLETVGNAQISTAQSKFGGSSMYFDGTGDYLAIPSGQNLAFGTGDFTVECWVRFDSTADFPNIFSTGTFNTSQFTLRLSNNTAKFQFYAGNAGTVFVTGTTTVAINTWYHVAVVRYSGTTKLYVNGISDGTDSNAFTYLSSGTAAVGEQIGNADGMQGYIDDLRITKGIARYTTNFTPPITAFPLL